MNTGRKELLCLSESKFDPPLTKEGPWETLWAHPHPSYSPNGKMVMFNSCKNGKDTQLYIAITDGEK